MVSKVVSPPEYLQVVPVGHQLFNVLVNLRGLLALTPAVAKYNIGGYVLVVKAKIPFETH